MIIQINVKGAKTKLEELAAFLGWRVKDDGDTQAILDEFGNCVLRTPDPDHFEFDAVDLISRKYNNIRQTVKKDLLGVVYFMLNNILEEAAHPEMRKKGDKRLSPEEYAYKKMKGLIEYVRQGTR